MYIIVLIHGLVSSSCIVYWKKKSCIVYQVPFSDYEFVHIGPTTVSAFDTLDK